MPGNACQDGKQEYLKALELHPSDLAARMGMAQFSMLTESYVKTFLEYDKINQDYPGTPPVLMAIGRVQNKLNKFDKAVEAFQQAIEKWEQFRLTPPEEAYLEATRIAARQLRNTDLAIS